MEPSWFQRQRMKHKPKVPTMQEKNKINFNCDRL